jgi:hypothetical protein
VDPQQHDLAFARTFLLKLDQAHALGLIRGLQVLIQAFPGMKYGVFMVHGLVPFEEGAPGFEPIIELSSEHSQHTQRALIKKSVFLFRCLMVRT